MLNAREVPVSLQLTPSQEALSWMRKIWNKWENISRKTYFFHGAFTAWINGSWLLPRSRPTAAPPFDRPSKPLGPADTLCRRRASPPPRSGWCRPRTPSHLLPRPQRRPGRGWRPTWSGPCCFWRKTTDPAGLSWCPWPSKLQSSWKARCRRNGSRTGPGGRTEGSEPPRSGRGLSEEWEEDQ